jgi:glycosyltransferase involved in cell wall biosynthesis
MKIAMVTATFPPYRGGTGHVAAHYASALSAVGHEVTVLTAARAGPAAVDVVGGIRVERLAPRWMVGNAPLLPGLAARLGGFDVVHLHYPDIFGALAASRVASPARPLVMTLHNRLQPGGTARSVPGMVKALAFAGYERWVTPRLLARAATLVVMSEDHFATFGISHPRVRVIPHGVDAALFRPRPRQAARRRLGLGASARVLLFVGSLDEAHRFKNVPLLIDALTRLREDTVLLIVGSGSLRSELAHRADRMGLGRRVWFLGELPPSRLPEVYAAADLTVLPSNSTESFGLVLLESMASGTPVVATALPGVRALVRHGRDGWLVDPGRLDPLVSSLRGLLDRPDLMRAMGRRGRSRVAVEYTWRAVGQRLAAVYEELAGGGTTSPMKEAQ